MTRLTKQKRDASVPVQPPGRVLQLVKYSSPVGELPAYLTPSGGGKSPAMIWLTGGFSNGIDAVWQPAPKDNDQTASVFWKVRGPGGTALVMMYPALRGGSSGPGVKESFYGEVDDVLAALRYLKSLHNIDSDRIYLGGHSTGGTLALLAAECSSGFRAVFAFGPVEDPATYGSTYLSYSLGDEKENSLRSPIKWLHGITSPTFVIEGTGGNIDSLRAMRSATTNANIHFLEAPKQDHFTVIYPVSALIASKIEADTGAKCNITMSEAELRAALSR
ncbi:MAG: alpha/beta hydrolase family protein [Candidatus Methylacidiphilales bacterium]|nr:prolyl oligopeptidase family serine peptidase [Candidatus Methylacidiphilales bacterium]